MKLTSTIKLPGSRQYEMHYISAEIEASDIPDALREKITVFDQWKIMQFVVHRETILAAAAKNLISIDAAKEQTTTVSRLLSESLRNTMREYGL